MSFSSYFSVLGVLIWFVKKKWQDSLTIFVSERVIHALDKSLLNLLWSLLWPSIITGTSSAKLQWTRIQQNANKTKACIKVKVLMVNAKKLFSSVKNMRHFIHLFSHSPICVTLRLIKQFNSFDHLYPNFKWINEKYIIDSNLIDNTVNIIFLPSCINHLSHLLKNTSVQ